MAQDDKKDLGVFMTTTPAIISFPNLITAESVKKAGKATGEPKFSLSIEFDLDNPDLAAAKAKAAEVARAHFGPNVDMKRLKNPFTPGDKLADKAKQRGKEREWSRGKSVLVSRSLFRPALAALVNGELVDFSQDLGNLNLAKQYFYNGVEGFVEVNFKAYDKVEDDDDDNENGKIGGVTAYLQKVVSLSRGKKLSGGGQSASEVFRGYVGLASKVDPTAGGDAW